MKSDNNWYGHRTIFSKYTGAKDYHSFSTIQHGYLNKFFLANNITVPKLKFIPYLCWNLEVKKKFQSIGFTNVIITGAPFIYLSKVLKLKKTKLKKKLIFFPPHNTVDHNIQKIDYENLILTIKKKYRVNNITVCLYYADFKNEKIKKTLRKNKVKFKSIVSRNNKNSLVSLYKEISRASHVVTCDISSVLFYSMFLKKKVGVLIKNKNQTYLTTKVKNDEKFLLYFKKKYPKLFSGFLNTNQSYKISCENLGYKYLKPKNELIKILGWNSNLKIFISRLFALFYDIKYGKQFRLGKKLKN